jgi:hypothetical protein
LVTATNVTSLAVRPLRSAASAILWRMAATLSKTCRSGVIISFRSLMASLAKRAAAWNKAPDKHGPSPDAAA